MRNPGKKLTSTGDYFLQVDIHAPLKREER
jgi:hypothetical protein